MSEEKRADGNKAFQDKKYQKALILYSVAVMRAPHKDGKEAEGGAEGEGYSGTCEYSISTVEW